MNKQIIFSGPVLGYAMLRLIVGVNFFTHGLVRVFGNYEGFVSYILKSFSGTFLPEFLLIPFAYALPVVELLVGALLIIGFQTRWLLVIGSLIIASLVFGQCLVQDWNTVGLQMVYAICFYLLLDKLENNYLSIDGLVIENNNEQA